MALTQKEIRAIAIEVVQLLKPMLELMLSGKTTGSPESAEYKGFETLDPARCDYEQAQLLEAERTMDRPDYLEFHAKIMAGRLEFVGRYEEAARVRHRAASKANKLRRQAEEVVENDRRPTQKSEQAKPGRKK